MPRKNDEVSSLSHTKWDCKYHVVSAPKYRRKAICAKLRADIGKYIRRCCMYKGAGIIEAHAMPDHIHMLVRIPPKLAVSSFMGYLKGKTSLMAFDEHANLKYNYGARHFWSEGYYYHVGEHERYRALNARDPARDVARLDVGFPAFVCQMDDYLPLPFPDRSDVLDAPPLEDEPPVVTHSRMTKRCESDFIKRMSLPST